MKVQLGTGGAAGPDGDGPPAATISQTMERLQPEAAYFYPEGGRRTAIFVFDLKDPSEMPSIAEPAFRAGAVSVDWAPVMTFEDLKAGLGRIAQAGATV